MNNQEIIKTLSKSACKTSYWGTFSRYIGLLDNYLENKPLSRVENKNHRGNEPRKFYLDLLANGFGVNIDYSSSLWEGKINTHNKQYGWTDDSFFYTRFFRRLQYFRENNLPINETTLEEMVKMGSVMFTHQYKYEEPQ